LNNNITLSPSVPNLTVLLIMIIYICYVQKDMTNFRLKLVVTLVNYPWNTEEHYTLEENEKKK
jgi:hypothetical protein